MVKYRIIWDKARGGYVVEKKVFLCFWTSFITWVGHSGRTWTTVFPSFKEAYREMRKAIHNNQITSIQHKSFGYYDEYGNLL